MKYFEVIAQYRDGRSAAVCTSSPGHGARNKWTRRHAYRIRAEFLARNHPDVIGARVVPAGIETPRC